jgi:hypothetical protein
MAKMYPDRLRTETRSNAERLLYEKFRDELPNEYTVFHSVCWLARNLKGGAHDGEADFVIAHPLYGILVLEAKGGIIRYEGLSDRWFSGPYEIKNPFDQAKNNKYNLLNKLKDLSYWRQRRFNLGHAVVFPDVVVDQTLRLDAPKEIILDGRDIANIATWVTRAMEYWQAQDGELVTIGHTGIEELIQLFCPSWELHTPLALEFEEEERQIIYLTEQQFELLNFLTGHRRVAIGGCAGSGKTTLALEQARRLAHQGFRILLTCFNRNLADYLRSDKSLPNTIEIYHFHGLCTKLAQEARLITNMPSTEDKREWYNKKLPELLMNASEILGSRYDAIVVDEGQDIHGEWWLPLLCLLNEPDQGICYVFYDNNQNLYAGAKFQLPDGLAHFPLSINCRNTQEIHRIFTPFYHSEIRPTAKGPNGRHPKVCIYNDERQLQQFLRKELHALIREEQIYTEDIVILSPLGREKSVLWTWNHLGNFRITDRWPPAGNEVYATTIHSFKGLESPVVILVELAASSIHDLETILYVGCSRARNHLIIMAESTLPESVLHHLGTTG